MLPIKIDLPEGFLKEEVRCGYTVSAEMKRLWAVELDLLAEFDRVCKKHGLTYFLDSGTLLGAVRHKGFIPWDDDIDVAMTREEYKKLVQIAEEEFRPPYFFQTPFTDPGLVMGGSRLRNSDTTLVSDFENKRPYKNKGIFIDIFVLDHMPDSEKELREAQRYLKRYWRVLRYASYYDSYFQPGKRYPAKRILLGRLSRLLKEVLGMERLSRGYERYCTRWLKEDTGCIGPLECERGKYVYQKSWYDNAVLVPFEGIHAPIPAGYDEILSTMFGDYMVMKHDPSLHRPLVFDPSVPYSEYAER